MNDNVLAVVMYIFENHIRAKRKMPTDDEALFDELEDVGFDGETICRALDWLGALLDFGEAEEMFNTPESGSIRVLSEDERFVLTTEAQGCLHFLEQAGILNAINRERVINRLLTSELDDIDAEYVKLITMLILLSDNNEPALNSMEQLLLSEHGSGTH